VIKKSNAIKAFTACLLLFALVQLSLALSPEAEKRKIAGNEYQKRREYQEARSQYMEALRLEPDYADAHYNLGMLYFYRLKDYPKALYHLNTYRRLETGATDMTQVYSHIAQAIEHIETAEREEYKTAVMAGTVEAFEKFIESHPVGYYADRAREEIKKLLKYLDEKSKREAVERDAYARATASGTAEAFDKFLADFPTSPKAEEARALRMRIMERNLQERLAYQKATNEDTADALEEFARAYPNGELTEKAKSRAAHLKAAEESLALARETGSVAAINKYLEIFSDTQYAKKAKEVLEEFKKAEVEKAAAAEAMRIIATKPQAAPSEPQKEQGKKESPSQTAQPAQPSQPAPTATAQKAEQPVPVTAPPAASQAQSAPVAKPAAQTVTNQVAAPAQPAKQATTQASNGEKNGSAKAQEELTPQESEAKRRAESRERARRLMEAEIKRLNEQNKAQQ